MDRRDFLAGAAAALGFSAAGAGELSGVQTNSIKAYLRRIMPTSERVEQFTRVWADERESIEKSNGWTYDAELGWVHCASIHGNGVRRSKTFYHYEADGARKVVNHADVPCRIHAYGNSFTHCDQVSDGETWEEYVAGHLQEPIRNYGVGGYGVYQAYRRMLKVEKENPAEYVILNIWDDDHFRSLDAWRSIRFGRGSACGFTLPHVRVDVGKGVCEERENLVQRRRDVVKLRDEGFLWDAFGDDPVLKLVMATRGGGDISKSATEPVAVSFGIPANQVGDAGAAAIRRMHTDAALFATRNIVGWTEQFVKKTGKKLMVMLSFGSGNIRRELQGQERFDRQFCEWLSKKDYPVLDMRDVFREDFGRFKGDVNEYVKPLYNGHHTPTGNFFMARAVRERLIEWLDPKPAPYR